ncbi:hypothetical protein Dda_1698 [Drechslerella dactyloides]|uniref:F-box domain-containing protein n=1 Tax=Drechslerella dactyloides TaxID=74499 RepID=A0AAD6NNB2_DREDA|nr:hypothetical protein Dda_1698 [Drechslerella dactyloides]
MEESPTVNGPSSSSQKSVLRFVDLPFDILTQILEYLSFRDLISLSLTTSGLRYVCPDRSEDDTTGKALCFATLHLKFLSRSPHSSLRKVEGPQKCPYCDHDLCSAACASALFLDSDTGIFYPRKLFPTHRTTLRRPANGANGATLTHAGQPPADDEAGRPPLVVLPTKWPRYSTVWCEHHRCPRDLFKRASHSGAPDGTGSGGTMRIQGANAFLVEYNAWRWKVPQTQARIGYWLHDQWLVGYKHTTQVTAVSDGDGFRQLPGTDARGQPQSDGDEVVPIREKLCYTRTCLHCTRPTRRSIDPQWPDEPVAVYCECDAHFDGMKGAGCRWCGVSTIRFNRIEGFDYVSEGAQPSRKVWELKLPADPSQRVPFPREGFWLCLATECKVSAYGEGMLAVPEGSKRMQPVDAEAAARALRIVRGHDIIPLPRTTLGIQRLPYDVLHKILEYLTHDPKSRDVYCLALQTSYCFVKASGGTPQTVQWYEPLAEPYSIMERHWSHPPSPDPPDKRRAADAKYPKLPLPLGGFDFSETRVYMIGQRTHKRRRIPLVYRRYDWFQAPQFTPQPAATLDAASADWDEDA